MQFRAPLRTDAVSFPTGTSGVRGDAASTRSLEADGVLLPLQPGRLLAIKQHAHQLQQHGSPVPLSKKIPQSNQRTADGETLLTKPPRAPVAIKPEPINYLKLRRTDESARALNRNRTQLVVATEVLQPSASSTTLSPSKKQPAPADESLAERLEALERMDHMLAEMQNRVFHAGKAKAASHTNAVAQEEEPSAFLASQLQQLYREQVQIHKESEAAARKMQSLLTVVRNGISLMYKFTPLFKIYARHKTTSAWHHWVLYVKWHRDEQARLALLWPYAVMIQRLYRTKHGCWQRARMRMELAWRMWAASLCIQRSVRGWLARRERDRLIEALEATKLQAAWRGRRDRKWVKKLLQNQLRVMLRSLTPMGNLHRLHEVTLRNPELARPLNAMLSLIEETSIAVDASTTYKAANARIAAKNAARPVEATRKQLFHAIFELSEIIRSRDRAVQDTKAAFNAKREEKQRGQQRQMDALKGQKLLLTREKIAAQDEREKMRSEELLGREYSRMLKTADADRVLHIKLDQKRREQAENARMSMEEYHTRYVVTQIRCRRDEDAKRLREVEKRHQFLLEQEQEQTQQLMDILKTDEMKRNEVRTKRLHAQAKKNELWSKMSKEQQAEAIRRLELKEALEEEERRCSEAILFAQQAHQRELTQRREESRRQKQADLDRELAAREAMEREEKCSKKAHFEQKRARHTDTWKAKREKEQVRYSLDPMHFDKIQAIKMLEERERRERYLMKIEDDTMGRIQERERKEKHFEMCRQRRKQEQVEGMRAKKERTLMNIEDALSEAIRAVELKAKEQSLLRGRMAALAKQDDMRRAQRALEARNRKEMHDEEMHQHRVALSIQLANEMREKREKDAMAQEELHACTLNIHMKHKADKRFREQCIFQMMREDVASMERQDWEEEGRRLEQLLWTAEDAVAFSTLVVEYPHILWTNVVIVRELCRLNGPPPFNFDYEAVQNHRRDEVTLLPDKVPRKKRKPRKFFYHEFFEDDPILAKLKPPPPPPSKARQRWRTVAEHFLGQAWSDDSVRKAYLLMSEHKYADATAALMEAVRIIEASSSSQSSMRLVRQVARCYFKYWESCFERSCLEKSLFYFHRATSTIGALVNPRCLQEIACVLENLGRYREAAEVLSGIIRCFPRYPRLTDVIFRGGIVMVWLGMYQQSREYLLHTLDARPFGWEHHEVLLLTARVMQFEGKPRRKLCSVAYEEAFRKNKRDAYYRLYPTWQEWIKSPDTWRDIGDNYFGKREFALARDAYQVMMKRIAKLTPHHGNGMRRRIRDSKRSELQEVEEEPTQKLEDSDWLRVARCAAVLNDRPAAANALKRWLARQPYRDRVLEQFYKWPLARWRLLGVDVPERVVEVLAQKRRDAQAMEAAKLKAIEEKRQYVLRQRSAKARERLIAWGDELPSVITVSTTATAEITPSSPHSKAVAIPERIGPWKDNTEEDYKEAYSWNEEKDKVS